MLSLPRGKRGAYKTNPQDKISQRRIPPIQTRGKHIAKDDLKEGDENHEAQKEDDEDYLNSCNRLIGLFPSVHPVKNSGPMGWGGFGLTGIFSRVHYFPPFR